MSVSLTTLYELTITESVPAVTKLTTYQHRYDMNMVTINSAATQTVILPDAETSYDKDITLIKLGAGRLNIQAPSTDTVANSASGGSIYNDTAEDYSTLTLRAVPSAKKWLVLGAHGTWKV